MDRRHDETAGGDLLERGLAALRGVDAEADALQVVATRSRVLRSIDERSRRRRRTVASGMMALILGTGTLSWAWATGRLPRLIHAVGLSTGSDDAPAEQVAAEPRRHRGPSMRADAPAVVEAPPVVVEAPDAAIAVPEIVPEIAAAPPAVAEPPRVPRRPEDGDRPTRALYRRAHELHFRGGDSLAALRAWDEYLAVAPTGRFAVEARYNRALALVRLGRKGEAAEALRPFARGEMAPSGYRQREARSLLAAIGADADAGDAP